MRILGYIGTKASNWQYICVCFSAHSFWHQSFVFFSYFVLFTLSTRFALFSLTFFFFILFKKLVVVAGFFFSFLLKLFTWFIGTIFEKFSFSFSLRHSNSFHSVPFHSARHWMFAFWFFALSDFMCIAGIKSFFLYAMLYDLIWRMFSSHSCFWSAFLCDFCSICFYVCVCVCDCCSCCVFLFRIH